MFVIRSMVGTVYSVVSLVLDAVVGAGLFALGLVNLLLSHEILLVLVIGISCMMALKG